MSGVETSEFAEIYAGFQAPIAELDCGRRCAPYNERGVPFCCDTRHAVPSAYTAEWEYLQANTDLWHEWQSGDAATTQLLQSQAPDGQVLIACKGHHLCQRGFRSIACRSFPFFPYITRAGEFIGLTYYWEYEDRCWVISNLQVVSADYRSQFIAVYDRIFEQMPEERDTYRHQSTKMRRVFGRLGRSIPLLHRNGHTYKITPRSGRMRRVRPDSLPKFGPYRLALELPFPEDGDQEPAIGDQRPGINPGH